MGWELLGGNPAPGSPDAVRTASSAMRQVSDLAGEAKTGLVRDTAAVGIDRWKGTAADTFRHDVQQLPGSLSDVEISYLEASTALHVFGDVLERAQYDARSTLTAAQQAAADRDGARNRRDAAQGELDALRSQRRSADLHLTSLRAQQAVTLDPVQRTSMNSSVATAKSRSTRLAGEVTAAEQTVARHTAAMHEAEDRLKRAAKHADEIRSSLAAAVDRAVSTLKQAERDAHLPSFWDRSKAEVSEWLQTYGPEFIKSLDTMQTVLSLLALLPTPLAPALAAAALVCGATALILSAAMYATQPGGLTGRNWTDLAIRTLGVASGGAAAKAGSLARAGNQAAARTWGMTARVLGDGQDVVHLVDQGVEHGPEGFFFAAGTYIVGKGVTAGISKAMMARYAAKNADPAMRQQLIDESRTLRQRSDASGSHTLYFSSRDDVLTRQSLLGRGNYSAGDFLPGNHGASGPDAAYDHAVSDTELLHRLEDKVDPAVSVGVERARDWAESQIPAMAPPPPGPEIDVDLNPSPYGGGR